VTTDLTDKTQTVVLVGGGVNVSGKEIVMLALARGLQSAGFNVVFCTSIWGGAGEFVSRLTADRFKFYRLRLGFISKSLSWKPIIWTLDQLRYWPALVIGYMKAMREAAPKAVIHTNWHHALLLLPLLRKDRDIYWSHETLPGNWLYGCIFRAIATRVRYVVCVSDAVARSLEIFGLGANKIVIVHNGIVETEQMRNNLECSSSEICIGVAGQIGAWKGHEDLIDAFEILVRSHKNLSLKVFGNCSGDFAIHLKNRTAELGIKDKVFWAGFVKDQALIYSAMHICVVPSRSEDPLPTTAIEAGFWGLPVVATAAGGLSEIVEDSVTGLLVPVAVPVELAKAIEQLVLSSELRRKMGQSARERMRGLFSEQRFIKSFSDLLERDTESTS
jgi:glycosyltransferase involved in cell wall biosynthesis